MRIDGFAAESTEYSVMFAIGRMAEYSTVIDDSTGPGHWVGNRSSSVISVYVAWSVHMNGIHGTLPVTDSESYVRHSDSYF